MFLTNILLTSIELFFELLTNDHKTQTLYKAWHKVLYAISKHLIIIESKGYLYIKDDKEVDFKKLIAKSRKIIVIEYQDSTTYQLYDREKDEIIISPSVRLNEENMLTSSLSSKEEDPSIEPIDEDLPIEMNQTSDEDSTNSTTPVPIKRLDSPTYPKCACCKVGISPANSLKYCSTRKNMMRCRQSSSPLLPMR